MSDPTDDNDPDHDADANDAGANDAGEPRRLPKWLMPLLIGLVTITAGLFTWRAGQLASSSAFEDRQSVGQTVTAERQRLEAATTVVIQAVAYVRYATDYAEAAALDDLAERAAEQGLDGVSAGLRADAEQTRSTAGQRATDTGVFGEQQLLAQTLTDSTTPLPFDPDQRLAALEAEAATGITSPGVLDPQAWADMAEDTRARVRALRIATMFLLLSVVAYTVGELSTRRATRLTGFGLGSVIYVVTLAATFSTVY